MGDVLEEALVVVDNVAARQNEELAAKLASGALLTAISDHERALGIQPRGGDYPSGWVFGEAARESYAAVGRPDLAAQVYIPRPGRD